MCVQVCPCWKFEGYTSSKLINNPTYKLRIKKKDLKLKYGDNLY